MAKIIIDIQDDVYRVLKEDIYPIPDTERLALVFKTLVKKGTPLPDNATNGDVIKAIFPDAENIRMDNGLPLNFVLEFELHRNYKDWWNAPYKAGDTDGNS